MRYVLGRRRATVAQPSFLSPELFFLASALLFWPETFQKRAKHSIPTRDAEPFILSLHSNLVRWSVWRSLSKK